MTAVKVGVTLYEADNTTPHDEDLDDAHRIKATERRPGTGTLGELTFRIRRRLDDGSPHPAVEAMQDSIDADEPLAVRLTVDGTEVRPYLVSEINDVVLDEGEDAEEVVEVTCLDTLEEWSRAIVGRPANVGSGTTSRPLVDERPWAWWGPDYDEPSGWSAATQIAIQGWWGSTQYYVGVPGGWPDQQAGWMSDGRGDEDDAPEGQYAFRRWVNFDKRRAFRLCMAADNEIHGAFDGRWVIDHPEENVGRDGFETMTEWSDIASAGWHLISGRVVNWAPTLVGANPTAYIWTLIDSQTDEVIARSSTADLVHIETPPGVPLGQIPLDIAAENAHLSNWTHSYTATTATDSETLPLVNEVFRVGDDSGLDVLDVLSDLHIDYDRSLAGRELGIWNKGDHSVTPDWDLVTWDSTAGQADPDAVNVDHLSWRTQLAPFSALLVRYSNGWVTVGDPSARGWKKLDLGQVDRASEATSIATKMLDVWADGITTATIQFRPADATQVPWVGFDVFSVLEVPSRTDPDTRIPQEVLSITVDGDDDNDAEVLVELGSPVASAALRLERMISRLSGRGAAGGLSPVASAVDPLVTLRGRSGAEWHACSNPNETLGESGVWNPPEARRVSTLRLVCRQSKGSGSTVVEVKRNGVVVDTLTVAHSASFDAVEGVGESWSTRDEITFNWTSIAHERCDVYVGVSGGG